MPNGNIQFVVTEPIPEPVKQPVAYVDPNSQHVIIIPGDQSHENINAAILEAGLAPEKVQKLLMTAPVSVLATEREQEYIERLRAEGAAKNYSAQMLVGNKRHLSQKMNQVEGQQALNQVMKKTELYSGMATIIPGIGTVAGFLIGGSVAIAEIFNSNANQKTAKVMLADFVESLFRPEAVIRTKESHWATIIEPMYRKDVNKLINVIKQTFKRTPLQRAADSLYLSDIPYGLSDIENVANIRIFRKDKIDFKIIGLIGAGLLALKFIIFKS